jgi:hypothetical protein
MKFVSRLMMFFSPSLCVHNLEECTWAKACLLVICYRLPSQHDWFVVVISHAVDSVDVLQDPSILVLTLKSITLILRLILPCH